MSIFGEIVEPTTRSAWEDWEDIADSIEFSLNWKNNAVKEKNIKNLIIIEGKYLSEYVYQKVQTHLLFIDSIPEVSLNFYQIQDSSNYLCLIKEYDLVKSGELIEYLKDQILNSTNVITIQNKPLSDYQVTTPVQECVIESITTAKTAKDIDYSKLEQPNIMSGFSAGVILLRDHMDLPGVAYICYTEYLGEFEMEKLYKLFSKLEIQMNNDVLFHMLSKNVKLNSFKALSSNMYI